VPSGRKTTFLKRWSFIRFFFFLHLGFQPSNFLRDVPDLIEPDPDSMTEAYIPATCAHWAKHVTKEFPLALSPCIHRPIDHAVKALNHENPRDH